MTATDKTKSNHHHHRHHHHHHHNNNSSSNNNNSTSNINNNNNNEEKRKDSWDVKMPQEIVVPQKSSHKRTSRRQSSSGRSESVLSTDSDIRFTRRKLGDSQKCGCVVIVGFLLLLLLASAAVYIGHTYFRTDPLPERIFRARLTIIDGDSWTTDLTDQRSLRFQHKSRDYRERINLILRRSDLRNVFEGSEILALDGYEENSNLTVHFILQFDPYRGAVSTADLHAIFMEEIVALDRHHFTNLTIDPDSLHIHEIKNGMDDLPSTSLRHLDDADSVVNETIVVPPFIRTCEPIKIKYCRSIGYNMTTYPNFFGHNNNEEVEQELITFRELVDAECFRQAFDYICRLLQPPCEYKNELNPTPGAVCREYCQTFWNSCSDRIPERLKKYLDCERFPESSGLQSCYSRPGCVAELEANALSARICDGIADCADLSDEATCSYCPKNTLYCGRGRACIQRISRCDGNTDCPDGSDEKDCLSIAPLTTQMTNPKPLMPHRPAFYSDGFALFSEKGDTGKLCAEGMAGERDANVRSTVAESLCKALGYEKVKFVEIRNDTEPNVSYVRVLDPRASEISFVRTPCHDKYAIYVACDNLECGVQSVSTNMAQSLPKMSSPGDWPWHVALYRGDIHVCDGTLVSSDWVLTTDSCFQGQPKATWLAILGSVRLQSNPPWKQRRRIIGMVKSPVEGSTAALIRLESAVNFSDFIRPICLPDEATRGDDVPIPNESGNQLPETQAIVAEPQTSRLQVDGNTISKRSSITMRETTEFFEVPKTKYSGGMFDIPEPHEFSAQFSEDGESYPKAEAFAQYHHHMPLEYPLPENSPQTLHYENQKVLRENGLSSLIGAPSALGLNYPLTDLNIKPHQWTQCNTLGWSRQRDHLQRVQLKFGDMAACENVSIATVNSMCAQAAFHKQDCNEEEFAGTPVLCLLPDNRRWALVGIASWRISCPINGVERPRMYDKITSNAAWIRDTINAT